MNKCSRKTSLNVAKYVQKCDLTSFGVSQNSKIEKPSKTGNQMHSFLIGDSTREKGIYDTGRRNGFLLVGNMFEIEKKMLTSCRPKSMR